MLLYSIQNPRQIITLSNLSTILWVDRAGLNSIPQRRNQSLGLGYLFEVVLRAGRASGPLFPGQCHFHYNTLLKRTPTDNYDRISQTSTAYACFQLWKKAYWLAQKEMWGFRDNFSAALEKCNMYWSSAQNCLSFSWNSLEGILSFPLWESADFSPARVKKCLRDVL